ncbi:hypothetical protein AB0L22_09420 [Micromonospora haikouensis]|uniref:hypothetical protein n=1 Tax=Micromonospora haikouensis TaxID=686309 RepID=UPI00343C78E6
MVGRLDVAAADFATQACWRRLTSVASGHGHDGHPVTLVGRTEPTDVYDLRCLQCAVTVVAVHVQR